MTVLLPLAVLISPLQVTADGLLRASMDRYASMKSFQAKCAWTARYGAEKGPSETRVIAYEAPNRFKVTTTIDSGFTVSTVSDGKKQLDLSTSGNQQYSAPASIAASESMNMQHPMFCGSMLYQFFAGSKNGFKLVDSKKGAVRFGPDESAGGTKLKVVKFYSSEAYGTSEVGIDPATKLVRFIRYHSEPMSEAVFKESGEKSKSLLTQEMYTDIRVDEDIPDATFEAKAPEGQTVEPMGESDAPPVPLGQPAPDFTVTSPAGQKLKLSALRGNVVFIDFWATWCPPCRETLPHTQKLFKEHGGKGLKVLAISDEEKKTVLAFTKKFGYTFPVYLDPEDKAAELYKVEGIPTFVIIDASGKLVDYIVGSGQEERVRAALKKAGVKL